MVGDQGLGPVGDRAFERLETGEDVVGRVDGLADVVEQGGEQEFLVVTSLVTRQLEHLERVVERVAFGVILGTLLDAFERLQEHPVELEAVDLILDPLDLEIEVDLGVFELEGVLELGDRGSFDRLAGDRGFEDVVDLVLGIQGQLVGETIVDVNMREDSLFAILDDSLTLDFIRQGIFVEGVGDDGLAVGKDVDVDIGTVPDVAGPDAADQAGSEPREFAHQAKGLEAHVVEVLEPFGAFMDPGHRLDLVADLGVGGEVAGSESVFDPELFGGLALGGEVLGFGPIVHQLGGEKGDLPPDAFVSHGEKVRRLGPLRRRWAWEPGVRSRRKNSIEGDREAPVGLTSIDVIIAGIFRRSSRDVGISGRQWGNLRRTGGSLRAFASHLRDHPCVLLSGSE